MESGLDTAALTRRWHAICALVCVLITIGQYAAVADRLRTARMERTGVVQSQRQLVAQSEPLSSRARALDGTVQSLLAARDFHRLGLPDTIGEREVVERLAEECARDKLEVTEFQLPAVDRFGELERTRVSFAAVCSYPALCSFLSNCREGKPMWNVERCHIGSKGDDSEHFTVELLVTLWSSVPTHFTQAPREHVR